MEKVESSKLKSTMESICSQPKELGIKTSLGVPYKQDGIFMGVMEFFDIEERQCDSSIVQDIMKKCDE